MRKCKNCGVILRDPVTLCPLCKCIAPTINETNEPEAMPEPAYPFADRGRRKIRRVMRVYLVAAIAAFVLCMAAALYQDSGFRWAIFAGAGLAYGYVLVLVFLSKKIMGPLKIVITALLGFLIVVLIDYHSGMAGWSFNYVLPTALVGLTALITILIVYSKTNWQSYILLQLMMIVLALIPFALYRFHLFDSWTRALAVFLITVLPFVVTVLIGGRTARDELVRRFHV